MMPFVHIAGMNIPSYSLAAFIGMVLIIVLFYSNKTQMDITFREFRRGIQGILPWCIFGAFLLGYMIKKPSFIKKRNTIQRLTTADRNSLLWRIDWWNSWLVSLY